MYILAIVFFISVLSVAIFDRYSYHARRRGSIKVELYVDNGSIDREAYAFWICHLECLKVYSSDGMLSAIGLSDGTFSNGAQWGWLRFKFKDPAYVSLLSCHT